MGISPVLVVDDDPDTRAATIDLLEAAGFHGVTARNGYEALQVLWGGLQPIALVIDLNMPLMDGEALCRELDELPAYASIPRIVVSGDFGPERAARCHAVGFIPKPLDGRRLFELLNR